MLYEVITRGLGHDLHARIQKVPFVEELQVGPSPKKQFGEDLLELPVDVVERNGKPFPCGPVDPLDRLGEVLEGFLEVLLLGGEKGVV